MSDRIRRANPQDVAWLGSVELAAATLFPPGRIPDPGEVTDASELAEACANGLLFVADADGVPVGFATCCVEGEHLHLDELAVHPDDGRRGLGRRLVTRVIEEAAARSLAGVSLTTFADLPWNGPFYTSMGFRAPPEPALGDFLREALASERARGLTNRVAMIYSIGEERT
ncbi:MAG: GNAT family N-acetyltransferase [Pseudomonadales bacterium]